MEASAPRALVLKVNAWTLGGGAVVDLTLELISLMLSPSESTSNAAQERPFEAWQRIMADKERSVRSAQSQL